MVAQETPEPIEEAEIPPHTIPIPHVSMLKKLSASSEDFANGSIALTKSLQSRRQVVVAANMHHGPEINPQLSCWQCTHDEHGIDLIPVSLDPVMTEFRHGETWAAELLGTGRRGDALVVCDPWGDHDLLCWALRLATRREIVTIAVTSEQPNLLSVLANYSVRVPINDSPPRDPVITVLRHLVQTAEIGVIPATKRATGPLRTLPFD